MGNNQTKNTQSKSKKSNTMKKIGKTIKDTFMEMSNSLAGWIDDTGAQFSGKKSTPKQPKNCQPKSGGTTQQKSTTSQTKSNA